MRGDFSGNGTDEPTLWFIRVTFPAKSNSNTSSQLRSVPDTNSAFGSIRAIWILGESISDFQLNRFKNSEKNKGKVCNTGFWKYSRHPNYFFEWIIWVSFFVFCLSSDFGLLSIVSPLLMFIFLTIFTGVKITEKHILAIKGKEYEEYIQSTNAFFLWFTKEKI